MIKTWDERCAEHPDHQTGMVTERMIVRRMQEEIAELRAALAQPEPEPVAWNWVFDGKDYGPAYYGKPPDADITKQAEQRGRTVRLLYTAPPQRKPLTEEEMDKLFGYETERGAVPGHLAVAFVRIVERAHGIGGEE